MHSQEKFIQREGGERVLQDGQHRPLPTGRQKVEAQPDQGKPGLRWEIEPDADAGMGGRGGGGEGGGEGRGGGGGEKPPRPSAAFIDSPSAA